MSTDKGMVKEDVVHPGEKKIRASTVCGVLTVDLMLCIIWPNLQTGTVREALWSVPFHR